VPPGVPVVAIDGPSGSGKGTISRAVASRVGWHWLDSGALYRLVALAGEAAGLDPADVEGHVRAALAMRVAFDLDGGEQVLLNGADVAAALRSEAAGQGASRVAAWPAVRAALLERQKAFAQPPGLVADGRDMGTVVFPDATLKVFLTASVQARAQRRYKQLIDKGNSANLAALSRDLEERDRRDAERAVAPLKPAPDAVLLDSSDLTVGQVVDRIVQMYRESSSR